MSSRLFANTVTQSKLAQAGTTPSVDQAPSEGLYPTMVFSIAGTRPEPAVSVPSENAAIPSATATAEPELEPPLIIFSSCALCTSP